MRRTITLLSASLITLSTVGMASAQNATPRNLILFIPDGLRGKIVTPQTAPAMAELRDKGVNFKNSHSLFPTFTMANGSAMASGHYLGDTGTFSNTIYTGKPVATANDTVTPFIEVDPVLKEVDEHFGGDYLNEETILKMARDKGFSTAAIGKLGPTLIFDHTDYGKNSIVIDDATGGKNGVPLSDEMKDALTKAGLPTTTRPARRQQQGRRRQDAGHHISQCRTAAVHGRRRHQGGAADVQARATSRSCWCSGRATPTAASTTPATASTPSRRGSTARPRWPASRTPTTISRNCARRSTSSGLAASTNIIVSSDHGFSTISKESKTSPSAKVTYDDTPKDFLPMGFVVDRSRQGAEPAAVRSQRQERQGRRQRASQGRQRRCSAKTRQSPTSSSPPMAART